MKKAIAVVLLYIAVMGVGLFYVKSSTGVKYSDPGFIQHFFWILVGLAGAMIIYCLIFRKDVAIPFNRERRWGMYLIVMVPLVLAFIVALFVVPLTKGLLIVFAGTLLVGIGEELAFRQVLFGALLKRNAAQGKTVVSAILISALVFSALHAVNVLGGQTVSQVAIQLVLTFFAGILFAGLFLQTKSIVTLILFHWLWDALTFMSPEKKIPAMVAVMPILLVSQIIIGFVLLWKHRNTKAGDVLDDAALTHRH
ncbi:CPBP family intramembrane glutamic endopeptidase [Brevibacterium gallinarum]|uniref:CPBP family intramembrane metalloprotease n=1 Tax=Brevibacterium gallinarum TaxID=2762220 RepID=A0ABR8WW38_9MICO|nr:CPBP family intramembrane glutamic endopeptidase [Brevibacterium gallinarum]MBD8021142.1 CPBP family intramembrane metalloprotease [Brevibacterium gallinarum]